MFVFIELDSLMISIDCDIALAWQEVALVASVCYYFTKFINAICYRFFLEQPDDWMGRISLCTSSWSITSTVPAPSSAPPGHRHQGLVPVATLPLWILVSCSSLAATSCSEINRSFFLLMCKANFW
jgi:hypothetical protein